MPASLRLALTADLHWGLQAAGDEATRQLVSSLNTDPPDVLVLAGDVGSKEHFVECLALFEGLPCRKALVPGNHDIWVVPNDPRGDSLDVYGQHLPALCREHGFHYLDQAPVVLKDADLALVGSINWYDYSWSLERLKVSLPNWEYHLQNKLFSRGRHNDANFVRWQIGDVKFTQQVVVRFRQHLEEALASVGKVVVVTHHPCLFGLNFPTKEPATTDRLLWDAFSGNRSMEELLEQHQKKIPLAFSGHTHCARETQVGGIRGYNIGGDYHFKRLMLVEWPEGKVTAREFGQS